MKIALFGDGRMGKAIRASIRPGDHQVVAAITRHGGVKGDLKSAQVGIDFSAAEAVDQHLALACELRLPLVIGTTGLNDRLSALREKAENAGIGVVYGPNFSLGANLMLRLVAHGAELFSAFDEVYEPYLTEVHHRHKKDAPSGTALALKGILERTFESEIPVTALRVGQVPGTHTVGFESEADGIALTHAARTRSGFAEGALLAGEWIIRKKGFFEFSQFIDERLAARRLK
jgi:4-hydroxy-tetrahydrodipicolinate reductase